MDVVCKLTFAAQFKGFRLWICLANHGESCQDDHDDDDGIHAGHIARMFGD